MPKKLSPASQEFFHDYVKVAKNSPENLSFLLDHLGENICFDYSVESLERVEKLFRKWQEHPIRLTILDVEQFADLLSRYLGECVIHHTNGQWTQCQLSRSHQFGDPCIDKFGNQPWDIVFPIEIASSFVALPQNKPDFKGVREKRVLASVLENAIAIQKRSM